jgi:ribosomal protein S27E
MNIVEKLTMETSGLVTNHDRGYNGMSSIGDPCARKLQYNMYMASGEGQLNMRIMRLFNVGHAFETVLFEILKDSGIHVYDSQSSYVDENEMWFGHSDGEFMFNDIKYLLEVKTHNDKSFKLLQKSGVKKSKPAHYDQMTMYMGYGGFERGLYAACNKNDSDLYFEEVVFDPKHFEKLKSKSVDVIASDILLPRIGNSTESWFECKFCDHLRVCFGRAAPSQNCRTCHWVEPSNGNKWACTYGRTEIGDVPLSLEEQKAGCDNHMYGKMFNETA